MKLNKDLDILTCIIRNIKLNCINNSKKIEDKKTLNIINEITNKLDVMELNLNDIKNLYLIVEKEI